jgi:parallel beta-helix repeat protein
MKIIKIILIGLLVFIVFLLIKKTINGHLMLSLHDVLNRITNPHIDLQATAKNSKDNNQKISAAIPIKSSLPLENNNSIKSALSCVPKSVSSVVVKVKSMGAKGDGVSNDTPPIQAAIDQVAGSGGTVLVEDGTYMIDAINHLQLKSNMTFRMTKLAVLKAIPNSQPNSGIIRIENASNVNLVGGTIQGERNEHKGNDGEWGMGIEIYASQNVILENIISKDNWGDGFYVGNKTLNSLFCAITADNNRRQGMSITSADGVTIKESIFKNTNGTAPMDGLDIEPNKGETVANIQVLNSLFLNNKGCGIESTVPTEYAGSAFVKNLILDGNTVENNGAIGSYSAGIKISGQSGQKIINNIVKNNAQDGIIIVNGSVENIVMGNTIAGNGNQVDKKIGYGILLYEQAENNTVTGNTVFGNINKNIFDAVGENSVTENQENK